MNASRNGNFTSSEIVALMRNGQEKGSMGVAALTYIDECNFERKLDRTIENEGQAKPLVWGKLVESVVFGHLGLEYKLCSGETLQHPTIDYWLGSPDGLKEDDGRTVMDIKSPITLKSFCQLVDPLYQGKTGMETMNIIRDTHKEGDKYYYQLVSNAIITKSKYAELIVYCPYMSELEAIRELASDGVAFSIAMSKDEELPWLHDNGYYKNLNIIRFEVPNVDKWALEARVKQAGEKLIQPIKLLTP